MNKKGIIYCRVSTTEQAEEGMSLQAQEHLCREYAVKNDIDINESAVFIERGESAKTVNRTELQKLMKFCKLNSGKYDLLLIYKVDRLSRDTADYGNLRIFFKSCGIEVVSITEPFDDSPIGKFMENTMANIAQLDNDIRAERTKMGMVEALKEGRYIFRSPFGYIRSGSRKTANIIPDDKLKQAIEEVFNDILKCNKSLEEIRKAAYERGLTRKDGKILTKSHFYRMLKNPVYKGYIDIPSLGISQVGSFPAIVSEVVFDTAQLIILGKRKKLPIYKKVNPDFPLKGIIKHSCGFHMTANWAKKKYGHYRCMHCKRVNIRKDVAEENFIKYLSEISLEEQFRDLILNAVKINWKSRSKEMNNALKELEIKEQKTLSDQDRIVQKCISGE